MTRQGWIIVCFSYISGLLLATLFGFPTSQVSWQQWLRLSLTLTILTVGLSLILPRFFYRLPREKFWLIMGLVALFSVIYLQVRLPRPSSSDISRILTDKQSIQTVIVTGKTLSPERETANQKIQFWLKLKEVENAELKVKKEVTGKLYVTLSQSCAQKIRPNQKITIRGILYKPSSPRHLSSFDFKQYLEYQGVFAGLKGEKSECKGEPDRGWWMMRQRIVNAQKRWINEREASLMSSIVLGRKAVDLPSDLRELFIGVGMAHILAASGFHVALLLGIILQITRHDSSQKQFIVGTLILIMYIGLTGGQPSILRAALMGIAVLIGKTVDRKTNSLSVLLLTATLLLLWNPLWILDLGFQLSFLATFSLIVTAPSLQKYFDFLPPKIADIVAIPVAVSVWTLPLLIHVFSVFIVYSIPTNIITAPLVYVISLGGMISAGLGLIIPPIGSAIAWLLYYPTHWLIILVTWTANLPLSHYAIGQLPLSFMIIIYGVMILIGLNPWWRKKWFLGGLFILVLMLIIPLYNRLFLVQITLLPSSSEPMVVIQDRGKVILLNYGDRKTQKYTLLPFILQQGINQIDCVMRIDKFPYYYPSCLKSNETISIKNFIKNSNQVTTNLVPLPLNKRIRIGSLQLQLIHQSPLILQIKLYNQTWIWLLENHLPNNVSFNLSSSSNVLLWSGEKLDLSDLKQLTSQIAIALSYPVSDNRRAFFKKHKLDLYSLETDGIIQWTPRHRFVTYQERNVRDF